MAEFQITADVREVRSGVTQALDANQVVEVHYAELPIGDYLLAPHVCVERKAAHDFVASIFDKRLFGQVAQMKATFERSIVLVEGDVFATRSQIAPEALRGALSWLAVIEGVTLIQTRNSVETAAFIEVMARHAQEGLGYEISMRGSKPKDFKVLAQYAVEGLCGPATAKKLLAHFGSVEKVFAATTDQLCEVKGVGRKTAEQIRELVTFPVNG
ncbi:ERCC4 domain-containing protein [Acidovorax sp. sic0104]|uniref:ERCC4 domain-containing protein n=1 Tax=Acidovorax sp. sic0104 TaxID=2854784 RepID=UPI001C4940BB|nr:ERCC4 domain-containing protein [Acidovorax sp. sic0104]MBV7541926.1 hypothetical protein [Acidovorax sp. sic0104]